MHDEAEEQQDYFEKIKLEMTVIMAEKNTFKRELDKVDGRLLRALRDIKNLNV